jgi:hypothetical protein
MEIWEPKAPGILWATPGLLRDCFTPLHGEAVRGDRDASNEPEQHEVSKERGTILWQASQLF